MKENRHGRMGRPFSRYRERVEISYASAAHQQRKNVAEIVVLVATGCPCVA